MVQVEAAELRCDEDGLRDREKAEERIGETERRLPTCGSREEQRHSHAGQRDDVG